MPVFRITKDLAFPDPLLADEDGLLGVGGDFDLERLLLAYSNGIFPWPHGKHLLWFSPDPRFVLVPSQLHVSRSLGKTIRRGEFQVHADRAFDDVIRACAAPRKGEPGTWITPGLSRSFSALHAAGIAHSIETYQNGKLVGGLYGLALGRVFFGESMFSNVPDASKIALVALARKLATWDFVAIDCQTETAHTVRLGAAPWERGRFVETVQHASQLTGILGPWTGHEFPLE